LHPFEFSFDAGEIVVTSLGLALEIGFDFGLWNDAGTDASD